MKIVIDTGQDGTIINARVRQKAATEAEWLSKDPEILDGEAAFVRRADGAPVNFKLGDGNKKFSELPYFVAGDAGEFINVMGSELPVSGPNFPDKGYAVVGPGTYTQPGGPDVVVPSGHMGILNWDGSEWYLGSSVEMPDNSAKIAEWDAGTYEQDEVVTVDGIIYRALETTNEEPPSDKWEAIGGGGTGDLPVVTKYLDDFGVGAISYNSNTSIYAYNSNSRYSNSGIVEVFEGDVVRFTTRVVDRNSFPAIIFHTGDINNAEPVLSPTNSRVDLVFEVEEDGYLIAQYDRASTPADDYVILEVFGKERETIKEYPTDNPRYEDIRGDITWVDGRVSIQGNIGGLGTFKHSVIKVNSGEVYYMKGYIGTADTNSYLSFMNENLIGVQDRPIGTQFNNFNSGIIITARHTGWMVFNVRATSTPEIYRVKGLGISFNSSEVTDKDIPYRDNTAPSIGHWPEIGISTHYRFYAPIPVSAGDILNYTVLGSYPVALLTDNNQMIYPERVLGGGSYIATVTIDDGQETSVSVGATDVETVIPEDGVLMILTYSRAVSNGVLYDIIDSPAKFTIRKKDPLDIVKHRSIFVSNDRFLTLRAFGSLPITKERGKAWLLAHLYDGQLKVASFYTTVKVQGHGSASYDKKGFTLEPYNIEEKSTKIKVGDMPALDSFHFKAFYSDGTMARDVCNGRLWYDVARSRPSPQCLINHNPLLASSDTPDETAFTSDARYFTDGVPVNLELNGEFYGLYVLRMKKHRSNYALDRDNVNHIFLDSSTYSAYLHTGFNHVDWEVRNPKMDGYEEGGEVPDSGVLGKIIRFFDWMKGVYEGTVDARSTYENFIDLHSFLDWVIVCEVIGNWDVNGNNYNLITWDGDVWSMMLYDTDSTIGVRTDDSTVRDTQTGFVANPQGFIRALRDEFQNELKDRYQELRGGGIIDFKNFIKIYIDDYMAHIPSELYKKNFDRWGGFQGKKLTSNHIMGYLKSRIDYLDSMWSND